MNSNDDKKETRVINGETWEGHPEALDSLEKQIRLDRERKASIPWETIEAALKRIAECLRDHDTDSTEQLKRFIWSLWNGHHYVNLWDLGRVLDYDNSDAVATIFTAYMRGILTEDHLRWVLDKSGEMKRWEAADKKAGRDGTVDYPHTPRKVRAHCLKLGQLPRD